MSGVTRGPDPNPAVVAAAAAVVAADGAVMPSEAADAYGVSRAAVRKRLQRHHSDFDFRARRSVWVRENRHGTPVSYSRYGCRCDDCRLAWRETFYQWRRQAHQRPTPDRVHGTIGGYSNWGCRCDECTASAVLANAAYRRRRATQGRRA